MRRMHDFPVSDSNQTLGCLRKQVIYSQELLSIAPALPNQLLLALMNS